MPIFNYIKKKHISTLDQKTFDCLILKFLKFLTRSVRGPTFKKKLKYLFPTITIEVNDMKTYCNMSKN